MKLPERLSDYLFCRDCGEVLTFDELEQEEEPRGVFWGDPASETVCSCPHCGCQNLPELSSIQSDVDMMVDSIIEDYPEAAGDLICAMIRAKLNEDFGKETDDE